MRSATNERHPLSLSLYLLFFFFFSSFKMVAAYGMFFFPFFTWIQLPRSCCDCCSFDVNWFDSRLCVGRISLVVKFGGWVVVDVAAGCYCRFLSSHTMVGTGEWSKRKLDFWIWIYSYSSDLGCLPDSVLFFSFCVSPFLCGLGYVVVLFFLVSVAVAVVVVVVLVLVQGNSIFLLQIAVGSDW